MKIKNVVVIGSGTMGSGIAAHLCNADIPVTLLDLKTEISENAREKIKEVAKAQGFDYVLDSSLGGSVMMAEGKNIEPDVKKALGI